MNDSSTLGQLFRPWSDRRRSLAVVAALVLLIAGIGAALFQAGSAQREARAQVAHTSDILGLLRRTLRTGLDAETGQRGFLLTQDIRYLAPFLEAERDWIAEIDALTAALAETATEEQAERLARMREVAKEKIAELSETVALTKGGRREEALAIVVSDRGQGLMEEFRGEVAAIEAVEEAQLRQALLRADRVDRRVGPLLAILALGIVGLVVYGFRLDRRMVLAEADARDLNDVRQAREQADLLVRELDHRVKNLFSVILAIVSLTGRKETDPSAAFAKLKERIHALAKAHAVSQGETGALGADLGAIVNTILAPYAEGSQHIEVSGPTVALSMNTVTPLGLMFHELATNAAKYGGLSIPDGRVAVLWSQAEDGRVTLDWSEQGGTEPETDGPSGFGTVMIRQAAIQMNGQVDRAWKEGGIQVRLVFPGEAIRTTAPAPSAPAP